MGNLKKKAGGGNITIGSRILQEISEETKANIQRVLQNAKWNPIIITDEELNSLKEEAKRKRVKSSRFSGRGVTQELLEQLTIEIPDRIQCTYSHQTQYGTNGKGVLCRHLLASCWNGDIVYPDEMERIMKEFGFRFPLGDCAFWMGGTFEDDMGFFLNVLEPLEGYMGIFLNVLEPLEGGMGRLIKKERLTNM